MQKIHHVLILLSGRNLENLVKTIPFVNETMSNFRDETLSPTEKIFFSAKSKFQQFA